MIRNARRTKLNPIDVEKITKKSQSRRRFNQTETKFAKLSYGSKNFRNYSIDSKIVIDGQSHPQLEQKLGKIFKVKIEEDTNSYKSSEIKSKRSSHKVAKRSSRNSFPALNQTESGNVTIGKVSPPVEYNIIDDYKDIKR